MLHRKRAGSSRVEFFIEHFEHFLENVKEEGYGRRSPQKLQFFCFFTMKVFSYTSEEGCSGCEKFECDF
jgi:hypothetical protein